MGCPGHHANRGLAAADQIHGAAGLAGDTIKAAWLERAGVEQLGNFGHLGSVER
jgi:hypothetical protein